MFRIQRDVALRTRPPKPGEPLDLRQKLKEWEATAREHDVGQLAAIPDAAAEVARQARDRDQRAAASVHRSLPEQPAVPDAVLWLARSIASEFEVEHGRAPDQSELASIERFAGFVTRRDSEPGPPDSGLLLLRAWEAQEQRAEQDQRQIRRDVSRAQAHAAAERAEERAWEQAHDRALEQDRLRIRVPSAPARRVRGLTGDEARQVMAEAVFTVQTTMTTWTRADLIRHLGEALPAASAGDWIMARRNANRIQAGQPGRTLEVSVEANQVPGTLPATVIRPRPLIVAVMAESLAELAPGSRMASAWQWLLTGQAQAPVSGTPGTGIPPTAAEITAEARHGADSSPPECGWPPWRYARDPDPDRQQARRVLRWLTGAADAIPLFDPGRGRHAGARFHFARPDHEIRQVRDRAAHGLAEHGDLSQEMPSWRAERPWQWPALWMNAAWLRGSLLPVPAAVSPTSKKR